MPWPRSVLLFFMAMLLHVVSRCAWRQRNRKAKLVFVLKIFVAVLITFLASIFLFQSRSDYADLYQRASTIFEAVLDPTSDVSRGGVYEDFLTHISDLNIWLMGRSNVIGASDSGPLNLLLNGGLPLLISFLLMWFISLVSLHFSTLKIFLFSIFGQFLIGSETLFLPRNFLVVLLPVFF